MKRKRSALWRTVSTRGLVQFFGAVFFTFGSVGFLFDITMLGRVPPVQLVLAVALSGIVAIGLALSGTHHIMFLPPTLILYAGLFPFAFRRVPASTPMGMARLQIDAAAVFLTVALGYFLFVVFIRGEGARRLRFQTEVELARGIHSVMVPPIAQSYASVDAFGRSVPAAEVGGDLIDVVETRDGLVGLIADVSGHGVPAGTLMATVKSAARMRLRSGSDLSALLSALNEVIYPLKEPNMFVTFAAIRIDGSGDVEFGLAGHLPILHYSKARGEVARLSVGGLPLTVFSTGDFPTARAKVESGDILVFLTDGLVEAESVVGEQFGMDRIEAIITAKANEPLESIHDACIAAVKAHGAQEDDQTMLLLRIR
ncbi:MAG: serine/threonine-protein phosphatase [Acidobacteria bacterium]|nr:serine/threonine-protein phosphatase [Acidobacteriota bacterium]